MIFLDELKSMKLYRKQFILPIDDKNKKKGACTFLLTPNFESTKKILKNNMIDKRYYTSYYIEKDITYFINQEGYLESLDDKSFRNVISENKIVKGKDCPLTDYLNHQDDEENLSEAEDYVLNDPKKLKRSLKYRMNKAKHALNKISNNDRNTVGTNGSVPKIGITQPEQPQLQVPSAPQLPNLIPTNVGGGAKTESKITESYIECNGTLIFFNDMLDEQILSEAGLNYNSMLYKLLYKERFKTNKEVFERYDQVIKELPFIRKTYIGYDRYRSFNLFIDLSYYNQAFFKNNMYTVKKSHDLYFEFISRFINDKRLEPAGYHIKTIIIPIHDWIDSKAKLHNFTLNFNPMSMIVKLLKENPSKLKEKWGGIQTVFMSEYGYFKLDFNEMDMSKDPIKIITLIDKLRRADIILDNDIKIDSKKAIVADITDKLEKSQGIKIHNLTGDSGEVSKDELVKRIDNAASKSSDVKGTIDELDDTNTAELIDKIANEEDNNVKINLSRQKRIKELNDKYLDKSINGKKVSDLLKEDAGDKELPITEVDIDSVNEEWKNLQYINFENVYDIDSDIAAMLKSFSEKTYPVSIIDINVEDTSTSEDLLYTYTVKCEDYRGTRFTLKFDVPKFKNGKYMRLRGNDKTINAQLTQIPICKTDEDTVQIVSNYNKIFVYRFGNVVGKSYVFADKILKTLRKYNGNNIKITLGNNEKICSKYELPVDYIDMSRELSKIEFKNFIFYFNQDELRSKYNMDEKILEKSYPIGYNKTDKSVIYKDYNDDTPYSQFLYVYLRGDDEFNNIYKKINPSVKYAYSQASILSNKIPLVVVASYSAGLTEVLKRSKIKYDFVEKKTNADNTSFKDFIKFKDGYLFYELSYSASLLMNGLKECDTDNYTISEIDGKSMWLDFLDIFGSRLLSDGLDNFYDLMMDPITKEVAEYYKLPTDYIGLLLYSNDLLSDNAYTHHGDMNGRRYRSNELLAGYVYKALADSYGKYSIDLKRNSTSTMSIKRSDIIDRIMKDPTFADLSKLTPVLEAEAGNATTYKGLTGMNTDRAYSLDKRTFTDSMANVLGMSTGFAGNVGITRQATIDMNIKGKRGYIKTIDNTDDYSITKTFTVTEALTPFGSRHDDPFRTAMTYIQTSKHGMRVKNSMPMLISNGCDQALPYLVSDTFAFKAKQNGKVTEKTDEYMIITYNDGTNDMVDLRRNIQKNSDGGFFITLKLDTDLKLGSTVKKDQVVAYDKESFSDSVGGGNTNNIAYNIGPLAKVAILNTDENFEDSAIISDWLANAMSSDVIVKKEVILPKNTNVLFMIKKGQQVQEGDPLLIFQNAFEEEDVNFLLKTLADESEDDISDLGRIPIKSKVTGWVQDIKIYRTVEKNELSDSLKKIVNQVEKPISDINKISKKYNIDNLENTDPDYKLEAIGKLKNAEDSVLVEFYLAYNDRLSIGDKIIYYSANKGVVKGIFPKGKEPYTDYDKDEKIQSTMGVSSINGRMVCSPMIVGSINKVLIELDKKVKEMAGIPYKHLNE